MYKLEDRDDLDTKSCSTTKMSWRQTLPCCNGDDRGDHSNDALLDSMQGSFMVSWIPCPRYKLRVDCAMM